MSINKIHSSYFTLALFILAGWFIQSTQADYWSVSYYDYDYDYSRSDRISREHRDAGDVDDWIERGNSTVTISPHFRDGIRLSAWASDYISDDKYDFALASAVYLFDIPRRAQYIEIKVRYRGEGRKADFDDYEEIAGRLWTRNFKKERENRRYGDDERETLYGDTFVLRANRRSETIKIPAVHHVGEDGVMELHVVVENGGLLDVEYVDVATYRYLPEVRVVNRYIRSYEWRPWHYYTYFYFYDGPVHYVTDYNYYVRWSYPVYDVHYVTIRKNYRAYLHRYYKIHPSRHYRYSRTNININVYDRGRVRTPRLSKWTPEYERVRHEYDRSRLMKKRRRTDIERVRNDVRVTIDNHRRQPVLSDRLIQSRDIRMKRRRSSTATSEPSSVTQDRGTSRVRIVRPVERQNEDTKRIIRNRSSRSSTKTSGTSSSTRSAIKKRRASSSSSSSRSAVKSNRSDSSRRDNVTKSRSSSSSSSSKTDDDDKDEEEQKRQQRRESTKKRRR